MPASHQKQVTQSTSGTFATAIGSFVALLICLAITLVLAMMSYYWLERPILDRFARRPRADTWAVLATP